MQQVFILTLRMRVPGADRAGNHAVVFKVTP
jgi:hypothetical protein